jgi:hypothetical protein
MKLFGKLVRGKSTSSGDQPPATRRDSGSSNNDNGSTTKKSKTKKPKSRQNSLTLEEQKVPDFVGGKPPNVEELSDLDMSLTPPYVSPTAVHNKHRQRNDLVPAFASIHLTDEEKGMILVDDSSVVQGEEENGSINNHSRSNGSRKQSKNSKGGGTETPLVGSPLKNTNADSNDDLSENVKQLYRAQSEHHTLRTAASFHPSSSSQPYPLPSKGSPQSLVPPAPTMLNPSEMAEVNRLMSIGYSYENALQMIGIDPTSMTTPPSALPPMSPHGLMMPPPMPYPMMPYPPHPGMPYPPVPPGAYPHYPPPPHMMGPMGMSSPYSSYYPQPPSQHQPLSHQQSFIQPPSRQSSSGGGYYQENEDELLLAIQRSLEEDERRKHAVSYTFCLCVRRL